VWSFKLFLKLQRRKSRKSVEKSIVMFLLPLFPGFRRFSSPFGDLFAVFHH
jgi:hypothetical protein